MPKEERDARERAVEEKLNELPEEDVPAREEEVEPIAEPSETDGQGEGTPNTQETLPDVQTMVTDSTITP